VITTVPITEQFGDCERSSAPAQKLHNIPEILREASAESARAARITDHRRTTRCLSSMPIPMLLADDGWWLCSRPRTPSIDVAPSPANASQHQMKSFSIAIFRIPVLPDSVPRKPIVAVAATGFADWLFYDHRIGVSLALFLLVLAGLALLTNRSWIVRRETPIAVTILSAGLAPLIEAFNVLSALFGVLAVAAVVSSQTNPFIENLRGRFDAASTLLLVGPFRLVSDIARSRIWSVSPSRLTVWIVPLLLSGFSWRCLRQPIRSLKIRSPHSIRRGRHPMSASAGCCSGA
jgi:hypothetical protein